MLENILRRITALPRWAKILLSLVLLVLALILALFVILLAPFVALTSFLVLLLAASILIYRVVRRRPLRRIGPVALASLVVLITFSGVSHALYPEHFSIQAYKQAYKDAHQARLEEQSRAEAEAKAAEEAKAAAEEADQDSPVEESGKEAGLEEVVPPEEESSESAATSEPAKEVTEEETTQEETTQKAESVTSQSAVPSTSACPPVDQVLNGVYHPERLKVLDFCLEASGTVAKVLHEKDGDLHIRLTLDGQYGSLLSEGNNSKQHGDLVVEHMARDGGHLTEPKTGDHLDVVGAWVTDTEHSWNEIHPVFSASLNGKTEEVSSPKFGGSPANDRARDAAVDCSSETAQACAGYGKGTDSLDEPPASNADNTPQQAPSKSQASPSESQASPSEQQPSPSPSNDSAAPAGATARCNDGTYSTSQNRKGTCSRHGGVAQWLR